MISIFLILSSVLSQAATNCACSKSAVVLENTCYCDAEADKLLTCLKQKNPSWPFAPGSSPGTSNCPSPVSDPSGFSTCIQNSMPKNDPNAKQIETDCVSQTKAAGKPTNGNVSTGSVVSSQTGSSGVVTGSGTSASTASGTPNGCITNSGMKNSAALFLLSLLI